MSSSTFSLKEGLQQCPYQLTPKDKDGLATTLAPGTSVQFAPKDPTSALIVPNSNDPTGLTGTVVAPAGFVGAVELDATYTNPGDGTQATGVFTGQITGPGEPVSFDGAFGAAVPIPPPAEAPAAKKVV